MCGSCEWSSLDLQNMRMASPLMIIDGKENRATLPIRANAPTRTPKPHNCGECLTYLLRLVLAEIEVTRRLITVACARLYIG